MNLLIVVLATAASAQVIPLTPREQAYKTLEQNGVSPTTLRGFAAEALRQNGEVIYDVQRLEVKGMRSADDTNKRNDRLFDLQRNPSFQNDEVMNVWRRETMVQKAAKSLMLAGLGDLGRKIYKAVGKDLATAAWETMMGETARGGEVFEGLTGSVINELVAHSWGTELTYNAILSRKIMPPKRLIVVGVPDNNREKWEKLAHYTGTEVIYLSFTNDPIHQFSSPLERYSPRGRELTEAWEAACVRSILAHRCKRPGYSGPGTVRVIREKGPWSFAGNHDRFEYYDRLEELGLLTVSHQDLGASQEERIKWEARRQFMERVEYYEARYTAAPVADPVPVPVPVSAAPDPIPTSPSRQQSGSHASSAGAQESFVEPLEKLARKACRNPDAISSIDLAEVDWGWGELGNFNDAGKSLGACEHQVCQKLINLLQQYRTRPSAQDVRNYAHNFRGTHPSGGGTSGSGCFKEGSNPRGCPVVR